MQQIHTDTTYIAQLCGVSEQGVSTCDTKMMRDLGSTTYEEMFKELACLV